MHYQQLTTAYTITAYMFSQNLYNRHWSRRRKHWLIARVYYSSMIMSNIMKRRWLWIALGDLSGTSSAICFTPWMLRQQIATAFILWTASFVGNPSQMRQTCDRYSQDYWHPGHLIFYRQAYCSGKHVCKISMWITLVIKGMSNLLYTFSC